MVYWGEAAFTARRGAGFAADDPLCLSCHCIHGPAALPASLDPERIEWSAATDWGAGDPPGSFGEDGVVCDAVRVCAVRLCLACLCVCRLRVLAACGDPMPLCPWVRRALRGSCLGSYPREG